MNRFPDWMTNVAINTVLACMSSADTEVISPKHWWSRAKSALEASADCGDSWEHFCSKMASKLQIETFKEVSTVNLEVARSTVGDNFSEFMAFCRRDCVYIIALAQQRRAEEREAYKASKSKKKKDWEGEA